MEEKFPQHRQMARAFENCNYLAFLLNYYGNDSSVNRECHAVGMALFDAVYTELQSLPKTFNFLCSSQELTPGMLAVMEQNQKLFNNFKDGDTPNFDAVERALQAALNQIGEQDLVR